MNKTLVVTGCIFLIALFAFLYVQARNSYYQTQQVQPRTIQLTPTSADAGQALRGPSVQVSVSGNPTTKPYPTAILPSRQLLPTTRILPTSTTKPTPTKTPTSIPTTTYKPTPTRTPTPTPSDPSIINYTGSGFVPSSTTVHAGTWVTFRNYSTASMKIIGDSVTLAVYPNFGERTEVGQYGFYQFQFTAVGSFPYRNSMNSSYSGVVNVIP